MITWSSGKYTSGGISCPSCPRPYTLWLSPYPGFLLSHNHWIQWPKCRTQMRGRAPLMMHWTLQLYVKPDYTSRKYPTGDIHCLLPLIIEADCLADNPAHHKVHRLTVLLLDSGRKELSHGIMSGYRLTKINKSPLILYSDHLFALFSVPFISW